VLSVLLTLSVGAVRLGVWDEVSEFIGISSPATTQTAGSPDEPGAVGAVLVGVATVDPTTAGLTTATPPGGPISVPPPGQVVPSLPVAMVIAATTPTRLVSSQGQVTVDIAAGAVRDDVTYHISAFDALRDSPMAFRIHSLRQGF
jgi:hypothetical protein